MKPERMPTEVLELITLSNGWSIQLKKKQEIGIVHTVTRYWTRSKHEDGRERKTPLRLNIDAARVDFRDEWCYCKHHN